MPSRSAQAILVVPCYNEENRLPADQFLEFAGRNGNYTFLLVDDGSTDRTFQLLDSLCLKEPRKFDLLKLERNSGKAEAVRQGFRKALGRKPDFIGYWDADLSTPLDALPLFLRVFEERPQVEMVFGSRVKLMGSDIRRNELRHYLGRVFATLASLVLHLGIYDTQCGAKLFKATGTLASLVEEPFKSRWIFDVELIARYIQAQKAHPLSDLTSNIYEFPLPKWRDIGGSKLRALDFLRAVGELVRIHRTYKLSQRD